MKKSVCVLALSLACLLVEGVAAQDRCIELIKALTLTDDESYLVDHASETRSVFQHSYDQILEASASSTIAQQYGIDIKTAKVFANLTSSDNRTANQQAYERLQESYKSDEWSANRLFVEVLRSRQRIDDKAYDVIMAACSPGQTVGVQARLIHADAESFMIAVRWSPESFGTERPSISSVVPINAEALAGLPPGSPLSYDQAFSFRRIDNTRSSAVSINIENGRMASITVPAFADPEMDKLRADLERLQAQVAALEAAARNPRAQLGMESGFQNVTLNIRGQPRSVPFTVVFDQPFDGMPDVIVSLTRLTNFAGGNVNVTVDQASITSTGFRYTVGGSSSRLDGVNVHWIAIGSR